MSSLLNCRAAIIEPSTAALVPALLGLPVLMVALGELEEHKYGGVLMGYPGGLFTDAKLVLEYIKILDIET